MQDNFEDIKPRGFDPQPINKTRKVFKMNTVNLPDGVTVNLPTDDLGDVIDVFYKGIETYLKAMADGSISAADLVYLVPFAMLLPSVFTGSENILPQAKDLTDEEIGLLVSKSDNYELGDFAPKARAIVKWLLVTAQTGFLF